MGARYARSGGLARALLALTLTLAMLVAAACGGDDNEKSGSGGSTSAAASNADGGGPISKCGLGNGKKATGTPIKLGAIVTKQPGQDFSQSSGMAKAYFDCVNDNGGINGHPISYEVKYEQTNPQQIASLATKMWEDDKVLGFVSSMSVLDCTVNHKYYEQKGIYPIVAGVGRECFETPNIAAVNMGPYYSALGAAQYLVRQGVKKLVTVTAKQAGGEYFYQGVLDLAKAKGLPSKGFLENLPITDGAALALQLADAAGDGGGVVVAFTAPEDLKILEGATQQGLVDKVKWACATPCNDSSVTDALGPEWDGKLGINAELNLVDTNGPDMKLYRDVTQKYAPKIPLASFGQMGFLTARIATQALLDMKGQDYTQKTVNDAFHGVKDFKTDFLCKPWYFGNGDVHVPNNTDYTIVPQGDKFVKKEDCFDIAALPENDLGKVRADEASSS
jgi:branched-chain amino acid transport system substrate-binding protein